MATVAPTSPIFLNLADLHFKLREHKEALKVIEQALGNRQLADYSRADDSLAERDARMYLLSAQIHSEVYEQYQEAVQKALAARSVLLQVMDAGSVKELLAQVYFEIGRLRTILNAYDEALKAYEEVLKIIPNHTKVRSPRTFVDT